MFSFSVSCSPTCPVSGLKKCSIPVPVPTTIICLSELMVTQVGSEEKLDSSSLQRNTQDSHWIRQNKLTRMGGHKPRLYSHSQGIYLQLLLIEPAADKPLTWAPEGD